MNRKKLSLLLSLTLIWSVQAWAQYSEKADGSKSVYTAASFYEPVDVKPVQGKKVKNVILMIGDGMGLSQISAAWIANRGKLNVDRCTYTGLSRTYCANKLITDSGAAGTAMATGQKTNYHSIAVDTKGQKLESLTDLAHRKGLKTGIVVTCNLPDATPSVFCSNHVDRDQEEEIATGYLDCNVDYILGAGRERFTKRSDQRNLMEEMKQKDYQVSETWEATRQAKSGKVFAVLGEGQIPMARERGKLFPDACKHAVSLLDNKNGFFAMFEGSRIDDCGHWNDMEQLVEEIFDFDRTVGEIMKWAEKDGETLVIVLADHETGGLTLLDGDISTGRVEGNFSTKGHSGIMVPVYAYGPGADKFTGIYENTEIFEKIKSILKL